MDVCLGLETETAHTNHLPFAVASLESLWTEINVSCIIIESEFVLHSVFMIFLPFLKNINAENGERWSFNEEKNSSSQSWW